MLPSAPPVPATAAIDLDVIAAVLAGDRAQFAVLVRRHNQALFRACRAVLGDDFEAEDAVQTAWLAGYRALASFRGDALFRTWMTRIAVREAASRLRHRPRLLEVPMDERDPRPDPERDVQEQELGRLLERQIDALPEGMRQVLVLRDVIELDTAETAHCLGIGEEAVRVRLHRARHALARTMAAAGPDGLERGAPSVWRFDGERCARISAAVMAVILAEPAGAT
jgi:RNA polymerase sigma-70 factor (ECF subfamily)